MLTRTEHFWDVQVDANEHLCLLDALWAALLHVDERLAEMEFLAEGVRHQDFLRALKDLEAYLVTAPPPPQHVSLAAVPPLSIAGLGLANTTLSGVRACKAASSALTQARQAIARGMDAVKQAEHTIDSRTRTLSSEAIRAAKGYGSMATPDHAAASMQVATSYVDHDADAAVAAQANVEPRSAVELLSYNTSDDLT